MNMHAIRHAVSDFHQVIQSSEVRVLRLGRLHVAADLSRFGLGTSRLIAGRAPCGCLGGCRSGGSQGGGGNMAHLLHLKGVTPGILAMWSAEKNLKVFWIIERYLDLRGDECKWRWQGWIVGWPEKFVSFGFMKTAVGTGEAQGLWLFLPFFRRLPVAPLLCTSWSPHCRQ